MLHNYHTHTKRCRHAVGEDRQYVENAIRAGVKTLGFSDHAPYLFNDADYYSAFRMFTDEIESYAESVRSLQKEYAEDIRILLGFELEYYPKLHRNEMAFLKTVQPDYCLTGQHFSGEEQEFKSAPSIQDEQGLTDYISQVLEGLQTGDFLYLAHPDLAGYRCSDEVILREYRRLCEGAKALNIPLEVNLLGIRGKRHYTNQRFFKIAAEVGNKVILGVDAHDPQDFFDTSSEEKALQIVKECNLNLLTNPLL
jgi:histidinol-phosphatase (PHP family)